MQWLDEIRRERPYPELSEADARLIHEAFQRTLGRGRALAADALAYAVGAPEPRASELVNDGNLLTLDRERGIRPTLLGLTYVDVPEAVSLLRELDSVCRALAETYEPGRPVPVRAVLERADVAPERLASLRPYLEDAELRPGGGDELGDFHVSPRRLAHEGLATIIARLASRVGSDDEPHPTAQEPPGPFELRWKGIEIERFRALRDVRLDFPSRLVVLVGVNGAGKSTALDAAAFVAHALHAGLPDAVAAERGFSRLRSRGASGPVSIAVHFDVDLGFGREPGRYEIAFDERHEQLQVEHERLRVGEGKDVVDWLERKRAVARVRRPDMELLETLYPPLDDLQLSRLDDRADDPIPNGIRQDLGRTLLIDREPDLRSRKRNRGIRYAHEQPPRPIRTRWSASVDELLHQAMPGQAAADRLASVLRELVPTIREVRRVVVTDAPATFEVVEVDSPEAVGLDELSAGMRQMLLLAAVYVHPTPPSLLLVEEPDAGIHVGAFQALRDLLRSIAQRSVVLATSHSPVFVGLLDPEREVVVLDRDERGVHPRSLEQARRSRRWLGAFEDPAESFLRLGMVRKP